MLTLFLRQRLFLIVQAGQNEAVGMIRKKESESQTQNILKNEIRLHLFCY